MDAGDWVGEGGGPPGQADGYRDQRHPDPEAAVGAGAAGGGAGGRHRAPGGAVADVRGGSLPVHRYDAGHLRGRRDAVDGGSGDAASPCAGGGDASYQAALGLWHENREDFLARYPEFDQTNPDHIDPANGLPVPTAVTPSLDLESEISPGSLYASGLIAAGGIVGLIGVCVKLYEAATERSIPRFSPHNPLYHDWMSILMFGLLAFSLYYFARKPLETQI